MSFGCFLDYVIMPYVMIVIDFMETTKCQWSFDSWPKPEVVE